MGYASTVDTGQVVPQALTPDATDMNNAAAAALTTNRIYFCSVTLLASVTVTQMRCQFTGAPTGNCDMGIYDATGTNGAPNNLLGHTGAIAATTGLFTKSLTANLPLSPGQYWLAWLDTVADTVGRSTGLGTAGQGPSLVSNSTFSVLPGPLTGGVADTSNKIAMMALLLGGFS